jgi:hypothetical protein
MVWWCLICPVAPRPALDEALRNAVEAVRLWVEDAIDGEALPPPRSVEALRVNPEIAAALAAGAVLGMVPLVLDTGRAVRDNLSLDAGLLDAIDEAAKAHGLTRSAFLASAAREKIEGPWITLISTGPRPTSRLVAIPTDRVPNQSQAKRQDLTTRDIMRGGTPDEQAWQAADQRSEVGPGDRQGQSRSENLRMHTPSSSFTVARS